MWIDDKHTAVLLLTGESDNAGRAVAWTGRYEDLDGGEVQISATTHRLDDERFVQEVYGTAHDGEGFIFEEVTYLRSD